MFDLTKMSPRESQIIALYAQGYRCSDIAKRLHLSVKTIESHKQRVRAKYNISARSGPEWMQLLRQFPGQQAA